MPIRFCIACADQTPEQVLLIFRHLNRPDIEATALVGMCSSCIRAGKMPWFRAVPKEAGMMVTFLDDQQRERTVEE
jgi:hypothetical protein